MRITNIVFDFSFFFFFVDNLVLLYRRLKGDCKIAKISPIDPVTFLETYLISATNQSRDDSVTGLSILTKPINFYPVMNPNCLGLLSSNATDEVSVYE